jgi:hypothetical protein
MTMSCSERGFHAAAARALVPVATVQVGSARNRTVEARSIRHFPGTAEMAGTEGTADMEETVETVDTAAMTQPTRDRDGHTSARDDAPSAGQSPRAGARSRREARQSRCRFHPTRRANAASHRAPAGVA